MNKYSSVNFLIISFIIFNISLLHFHKQNTQTIINLPKQTLRIEIISKNIVRISIPQSKFFLIKRLICFNKYF